ncbi:MAG: amidohydrolase family protein [Gammaproteobacteria bacterium]|nr:amidohydrolase family protein [Gammaproteobacteria bacterium]
MNLTSRSFIALLGFCIFVSSLELQAKESVDLVVSANYVLTMDRNNTLLEKAAIAIDKGTIVAIGNAALIDEHYAGRQHISSANQVIMPGLINGHTHSAMTLFRGIADDLALMEWLTKYIFPAEIQFVDPDFIRAGTQLACLEMIKGGTTTFVDMYFHPKEIAKVVDECGVRAVIAAAVIDQESGYAKNFDDAMNKAESFIQEWKNKNSRITPAIAAHAAYTIAPEKLKIVRKRANALDVPVSIHLSESKAELEIVNNLYQDTSINHLEKIDFFSGPTIGAHVVWPTAEEIPILVKRKVGAIHNPTSNMKISSGFAPVSEMLDAGVKVGLGTDGAASNNDLDMWEEIRLTALIHKGRSLNPKAMPALRVLEMATRTGAEAIGLAQTSGSLSVGKRADMILISLDAPHLTPLYDVISHLVYAVDAQDVQTVIVDGKILMQDRKVLTLDEESIIKNARAIAEKVNREIRLNK